MYVREAVPALVATLRSLCLPHRNEKLPLQVESSLLAREPGLSEKSGSSLCDGLAATTSVILAHGRNRFAEEEFFGEAAMAGFVVRELTSGELHPDYQCSDVSVFELRLAG
jgi:hypothetical protein